ncbi:MULTISPECIES: alpha-E domain-containing protein [Serratia]|uniref:alpha-E domain-containing protein n=1 Tax=Serratia TaxID=613 RepID=UPI0011D66612|nr:MULTISPECIES: alpha-E domain-containing protein [Serratia]TXE66481.1 alpha-E domain-containing protein [Serratia nematodiphila]WGL90804.1 alpha-E domain-containing protein [Serratia marcescens]
MLSRTASELYWMARYLERAESIARVLDVTNKLSMMPNRDGGDQDLQVPLNLTGTGQLYAAAYSELTMPNLVSFFALDNRNHSSIFSCLQMGWNNAHAVRGSLSSEVWECINATWIEMKLIRRQGIGSVGADAFFDWVKERAHLFRGAMFGTLLRSDAMRFIRLGTLLERADGTARLLEVKNTLMDIDGDPVREYYRMDTLLRAVSAREAYHSIYKQPLSRETIAELMILRNEIPRSLLACVGDMVQQLELIGGGANQPRRLAHTLHAELRFSSMKDLNKIGLGEWLSAFLGQVNGIAESIHHTYLEAQ